MEKQFLLLLLIIVVARTAHALPHNYYLLVDGTEPVNMTWAEVLNECRSDYSDMLTLDIMTLSSLSSLTQGLSVIWMGLQRDMNNDSAWKWLNTTIVVPTSGDFSQSLNWIDQGYSSHCAYYNSDSTWSSKKCAEKQSFFCATSKGITYYEKPALSWQDAQSVCHEEGGELPTITEDGFTSNGNSAMSKSVFGWIGLYRVGGDTWMWAEGGNLTYTAWGEREPVTYDCGAFNALELKWQSYPCGTP
ncbi:hypothetical protein WMY93_026737 [Mugilogobius chulae]|uniref:C-type lectin domain-containing protein n=1 Tax=Mugilogobius chulae TaxID=88201 RepID=A0AAW0MYC4_9GOBI